MDLFDLRSWPEFLACGGVASEPAWIDEVSIDSRCISSKQALFVALKGATDGHRFVDHAIQSGAKYAIVSKDYQPPTPLKWLRLLRVDHPLDALQSLASCYRLQKKAKVIAITGTYGKTMVKDLLQQMMQEQTKMAVSPGSYNSQIGVPLSLFTIREQDEVALIEMAFSQKNEMELLAKMVCPNAAIIAPLGKKHVATLNDLETIMKETLCLLKHIQNKGWVLLPENLKAEVEKDSDLLYYFWDALHEKLPHVYLSGEIWDIAQQYHLHFPNGTIQSQTIRSGFYYFANLINIAAKAAWLLGISAKQITETFAESLPEPMRTEIWRSPQGALFINDSYCSTPQAIDQSLKLYEQSPGLRKICVFSGIRKRKNEEENPVYYQRAGKALAAQQLDLLLLLGNHPYDSLVKEIHSSSPKTEICHLDTHEEAFAKLHSCIRQEDIILLKGEFKPPLDAIIHAFNESICNNICTINLDVISHNIACLRRQLQPHTRLMAMVKAFGYGTGELQMAKFLGQCHVDILGVSSVDEGVGLRRAGVSQAIFSLHTTYYETVKAVKWDLELAVSDKKTVEELAKAAKQLGKTVKVHLHVDTGMSRFGCRPEEALSLAQYISSFSELILEGIMTHFAAADDPEEDNFTLSQVNIFDKVIASIASKGISIPWKHACNSSGTLRFRFMQYNMARIGLALYGLYASEAAVEADDLQLAISLTSRIVGINLCRQGETVSYGRHYKVVTEQQRIAVIPLGYFDGLHRSYSNKGYVLIRGKKAPRVGKICMDFMMVDISDIPEASIGDPVLIFGKDEYGQYLPLEEFADSGNSIVHELITCLGPRVQRLFIHEERE